MASLYSLYHLCYGAVPRMILSRGADNSITCPDILFLLHDFGGIWKTGTFRFMSQVMNYFRQINVDPLKI